MRRLRLLTVTACAVGTALLGTPGAGRAQSLPDWAAPRASGPPGFPTTPGPGEPPGFPTTPGPGEPPGFPTTPGPGGPPGFPDAPHQVPADGGLTLLAFAGAAYAVRRLRRR